MIVAVDTGYGYTKALAHNGGRACFPSVIATDVGTGELVQAVGGAGPGYRLTIVPAQGPAERLLVGDSAILAGGVRSWDSTAAARRDYGRLVLAAVAILGVPDPGGVQVDLAVGLPLAAYLQREERRALRQQLLGLRARCHVAGKEPGTMEVRSVRVFAQAVGAYVLAAAADPMAVAGTVGLIDVGFRTTDYLLLQQTKGGALPDEARSGSVDTGVGLVYEAVARDIGGQAGVMVPPGMVEGALTASGTLTVRGKVYDVRGMFEAEAGTVADRIADQVRRAWGDRMDFLSAVLLAGGGGAATFPYLRAFHPTTRLMEDAFFANASGFLALARSAVAV